MRIIAAISKRLHNQIMQDEVDGLKELGADVTTCNYGNFGEVAGLVSRLRRIIGNAFELGKKASSHQSEIIYLNTAFDKKTIIRDALTLFILKRFSNDYKIVLKLHGSEVSAVFEKRSLLALIKEYVLTNTHLLLVLSKEEQNNFIKIGVAPEKIKVTANIVDKILHKKDTAFKARFNVSEEHIVLLFSGRLLTEKGILDLLEACSLLKQAGLKFLTICLGDGPLKDEAINRISSNGLTDTVTMVGYIPEIETRDYYANCDILVLPTYHQEGFSMAVFQAVAAGKPIITTQIRAAADYLREDINCLWSAPKNAGSIAEQIMRLAADQKLREYMSENNLQLAENFTKQKIAAELQLHFENMLSAKCAEVSTKQLVA